MTDCFPAHIIMASALDSLTATYTDSEGEEKRYGNVYSELRIRIQLFTLMRIRIQLFTLVRIRILCLIKVMEICDCWPTDPTVPHFEPSGLHGFVLSL